MYYEREPGNIRGAFLVLLCLIYMASACQGCAKSIHEGQHSQHLDQRDLGNSGGGGMPGVGEGWRATAFFEISVESLPGISLWFPCEDQLKESPLVVSCGPSPFSVPNVTFQLKTSAHVVIEVMNELGLVVDKVWDSRLSKGAYIVAIGGSTDSSGKYVFRFICDDVVVHDMEKVLAFTRKSMTSNED